MRFVVLFLAVFLAVFAGLAMAVVGGFGLLILFPILFSLLILYDYRVAVLLLAFLIPLTGSELVPQPRGLNPNTYALVCGVLGLSMRRYFNSETKFVWPPRVFWMCMVFPLIIGYLLALPHLGEGASNLLKIYPNMSLGLYEYSKNYLYRSAQLIVFSVLLANAIVDSQKPERFILLFALSALVVITYVVVFTLSSGVALGPHRMVISEAGMHYNSYGKLFALAFGPMLYVAFVKHESNNRLRSAFFGMIALVVLCGTIFNFARAGMLAVVVTIAIFLWQRKSLGIFLVVVMLMAMIILIAPEEWRSRMFQGADEVSSGYRGERFYELTSGRFSAWLYLLPDVIRSPVFGRGTESTLWSSAVTSGLYSSVHPHNMYLQILLDIGILGFFAVAYFYFRALKSMDRLSNHGGLSPTLQAFFAGSRASLIGMLVLAFTGGNWYPDPEQGFLWMSMGFLFAYWCLAADRISSDRANPQPVFVARSSL